MAEFQPCLYAFMKSSSHVASWLAWLSWFGFRLFFHFRVSWYLFIRPALPISNICLLYSITYANVIQGLNSDTSLSTCPRRIDLGGCATLPHRLPRLAGS